MSVIITIANRKGGVGKTTTAVTLADGLARMNKRVLLLDLDSQGHAALCLGLERGDGLIRWLVEGEELETVAINARNQLLLLTSGGNTSAVEAYLAKQRNGLRFLHKSLRKLRDLDVIILDTPTAAGNLQRAAIATSDLLLIPTIMECLSLEGMRATLEELAGIRQYQPKAAIFGIRILPTQYERSLQAQKRNFRQLAEQYGNILLPPIPRDARLREGQAIGRTLWETAPDSPAATYRMNGKVVGGYQPILERIMEILS